MLARVSRVHKLGRMSTKVAYQGVGIRTLLSASEFQELTQEFHNVDTARGIPSQKVSSEAVHASLRLCSGEDKWEDEQVDQQSLTRWREFRHCLQQEYLRVDTRIR